MDVEWIEVVYHDAVPHILLNALTVCIALISVVKQSLRIRPAAAAALLLDGYGPSTSWTGLFTPWYRTITTKLLMSAFQVQRVRFERTVLGAESM